MLKRIHLFLALVGVGGSSPTSAFEDWKFDDVTEEVVDKNPPGIGPVFDYAFVDLNDDNCLDIVVNNHHQSKPSPIWLGTPDHRFKFWGNMPAKRIPIAGFHLGEVDHDGDGKTDLVFTGNEGGVVVNFNRSVKPDELTFESVPIHSSSHLVSFADFDGDGKLETLVRPGQIFGDLSKKPVRTGMQFGSWVVADFDNDGWPDLFGAGVRSRRANWSGPRKLFQNKMGVLEEIELPAALGDVHFGGIPKAADFNNDGNIDLYVFGGTNKEIDEAKKISYPMRLFLGDGKFGFRDVSESAGMAGSRQKAGYSQVYVVDLDNDGHLDVINEGNYGTYFWRNNGDGTLSVLPRKMTDAWCSNVHMRFDDFDMDGRLDLVTGGVGPGWKDRTQSIRVFRNAIENGNHWLKIQLRQDGGNPRCIGAVVTVFEVGTRRILGKQMLSADTEGCHPRLHMGLGNHRKVDVAVLFPTSKETRRFENISADRYLILHADGKLAEVKVGRVRE